MPRIGSHASHQQIDPRSLLAAVQAAEAAGFRAAMCSDHFSPGSARQGESGFAWSWLGAALQATSLSFGVVNAPAEKFVDWLAEFAALGFERIYLHHVGKEQRAFIDVFGERVLPAFAGSAS